MGLNRYLILQNPGHNRVYYNASEALALAELKITGKRFSLPLHDISMEKIGNIKYLSFLVNGDLNGKDIKLISRLSFVFALFREDELKGDICLIPIPLHSYEYLDSKISSLLKYSGKTNKLFTRMMLNVALLSSDFSYDEKIQLLDPVAGKGTTLFEGVISGFDVFGVEIDPKLVHETAVFFKKFLEKDRLKHSAIKRQIYGQNKQEAVYIQEFEYAKTKDEFKNVEQRKNVGLVNGTALDVSKYFGSEKFHLIVGDLPYGIAHGNTTTKKLSTPTRNPFDLLKVCIPGWYEVLKQGGVGVIAWNSFVIRREKLEELFLSHGFTVLKDEPYCDFEHMVDQSIKRDILVVKKG